MAGFSVLDYNRKLSSTFVLKPLGCLVGLLTSLWEEAGTEAVWEHLGGEGLV